MIRNAQLMLVSLLFSCLVSTASSKEIINPDEAKADPDFSIQGEYLGDLFDEGKIGVQVIAQGEGKFRAILYKGGLPGADWKRGDTRMTVEGMAAELKGRMPDSDNEVVVKIADGKLTLKKQGQNNNVVLTRTERNSPTLGAKPPAGAIVLFDGSNTDQFDTGKLTKEKGLLAGVTTKGKFGSYKLHLEFRLSWMPEARGQGRSNSGVYIDDAYECQVLDSFGLEGHNNECGGFYQIREPDVNMCLPPLVWQTYDVDFTAPKYDGDKKVANARITIRHNGVVIHDDFEMPKGTPGRKPEGPGPRQIHLQGHGNKVVYRNIWLVEK